MKKIFITFAIMLIALISLQNATAGSRIPYISLSGAKLTHAKTMVTTQQISELKLTTFKTINPFDNNEYTYTGVLLKDLAKAYADETCNTITLTAKDGYKVTFTKNEWEKIDIMLAIKTNGEFMGLADSGPAKIVMPYSTAKIPNKSVYTPKWIWLISKIEFE